MIIKKKTKDRKVNSFVKLQKHIIKIKFMKQKCSQN